MKKNSIYALMSAIALTGAVGFSSCSSTEDGVAEVNPGYNSSTGEVPVEFIFNVASGSNHSSTRQSADATQAYALTDMTSARFRGIEDAHVMCFKQQTNGKHIITATTADKDYDMARVAAAGTLAKDNSTRVLEMSLPIKTNSMVFYGRAITNKSETHYKDIYGHLADADGYTVDPNLANVSFHLCKRLTDADKTKFEQIQLLLASVLTCIMETDRGTAEVPADEYPSGGVNTYGFEIATDLNPNMKWSEYVREDGTSPITGYTDKSQWPLEEKLAKVYKEMTTIRTAELRNASGPALIATITDLWTIINSVRCANPTSLPEAVAKYMAQLIHAELYKYFLPTSVPTNGGPVTGVSIRDVNTLVTALKNDSYWPSHPASNIPSEDDFNLIYSSTTTLFNTADLQIFPESFDLPQGATHILFDNSTKQFSYAVNFNSSAAGGGTFTVDDYYFPPELLYFGNSPIKVSDATYEAKDYPKTTANWDNANYEFWTTAKDGHSWKSGNDGEVKTSTRSVAMTNDINYGTALLQTTVQYGATSLEDNNHVIQFRDYNVDEANNTITPTGTSFILKGILVGGQYPRVGWNFLPALKDDERQGYVFDKMITNNGVIPASDKSEPNYTLVFDKYNPSGQDKVYVALELQNNTNQGFFGKDNLIPHGSNFYLIGELDPAKEDLAAPTWSSYHPLPPYNNADGTSIKTARVFMQDHKTIVNFKIGQYSLQYAYLNIPDLRSSSVTLGLSVDMEWSAGLDFGDVIIGGNTQTPDPNP